MLRNQMKGAFALPDPSGVLGSTLNYVSGTTFDSETDSFASVSSSFECLTLVRCEKLKGVYVHWVSQSVANSVHFFVLVAQFTGFAVKLAK